MTFTNSMMSLLLGAATIAGLALPAPVLAKNSAAQNAALDQMALQMYMQQQQQNQSVLAQQAAQSNYNAAQAAWAAQQSTPLTNVNYGYGNGYYGARRYANSGSYNQNQNAFYAQPRQHEGRHRGWHHDFNDGWRR